MRLIHFSDAAAARQTFHQITPKDFIGHCCKSKLFPYTLPFKVFTTNTARLQNKNYISDFKIITNHNTKTMGLNEHKFWAWHSAHPFSIRTKQIIKLKMTTNRYKTMRKHRSYSHRDDVIQVTWFYSTWTASNSR